MYDPRIQEALINFDSMPIPESPPCALPLLDYFRAYFDTSGIFSNVDILFIQHQLGPFVARMNATLTDGLEQSRSWFIDIPYSTNRDAQVGIQALGCPVEQFTTLFNDPLAPYAVNQQQRVSKILRRLIERPDPKPLLVIDDGAYFARAMKVFSENEPDFADRFRGTAVVEQTTRGHRYLLDHTESIIKRYGLRVVSIAKSDSKTKFESPFIGAAVSRAIIRALDSQGRFFDRINRIAVIGYGPVGQATTAALMLRRGDIPPDVIDTALDTHESITRAGATPYSKLPSKREYDLIVGCTGYNSFKLEQRHQLADGALLASGSSAAIEFNRAGFIELADRFIDDEIEVLEREATRARGLHATIRIAQEQRKTFAFLNAGFPVNFDGRLECLPSNVIQATHTLLYAAARQAMALTEAGFNELEKDVDAWIEAHALEHLSVPV